MNSDPRTALEQKARAWLDEHGYYRESSEDIQNEIDSLTNLLLSTQAEVLEEAVGKFAYAATTYRSRDEALNEFGEWLQQQAKERRG